MNVSEPSARYSRHGEGYVKVYRKLLTSAVFQDEGTLKVWVWCLLRANFQPKPIEFMGEEIELKAGDFITGTFAAADELKMSKSRVWRILEKLERWKNITIKSGNRFTVVSVNNYGDYQNALASEWESTGNQPGINRESTGNQPGTEKKDKKDKNQKKGKNRPNSLEEVESLFKERSYPPEEASAFFNYFQSNGWVIGRGRAPCRDWTAAAANWIKNSKQWRDNGTDKPTRRGGISDFSKFTESKLS